MKLNDFFLGLFKPKAPAVTPPAATPPKPATPAPVKVKVSEAGINMIKDIEGFGPMPYVDATGHSIGYGHFILPGEKFNTPMTKEFATNLLLQDIAKAEEAIDRLVTVKLNGNQYAAIVSFVFNVGVGNLKKSGTDGFLHFLNAGDFKTAMERMAMYNKSVENGVRVLNNVLVKRRKREIELFNTPV